MLSFLVDEDLPRSLVPLIKSFGYEALDIRDIGLCGKPDSSIAQYIKSKKLCLVTGDFDFSDVRNYPPSEYYGIVILHPGQINATAKHFLGLMQGFLEQKDLVATIPGKLGIVEPGRIRLRTHPYFDKN